MCHILLILEIKLQSFRKGEAPLSRSEILIHAQTSTCPWTLMLLNTLLGNDTIFVNFATYQSYIKFCKQKCTLISSCNIFYISENGVYELATGQNGKYCRNSTECKEFLNTESGFCNFDHNITGFCESCDDIFESCVGQGFLCERGFRECSSTCEGKDIHFVIKCNHYIFRYSMFFFVNIYQIFYHVQHLWLHLHGTS